MSTKQFREVFEKHPDDKDAFLKACADLNLNWVNARMFWSQFTRPRTIYVTVAMEITKEEDPQETAELVKGLIEKNLSNSVSIFKVVG